MYQETDGMTRAQREFSEKNGMLALKGSSITFYKNGVCQGKAVKNIWKGTYFPALSLYMGASARVNFGIILQTRIVFMRPSWNFSAYLFFGGLLLPGQVEPFEFPPADLNLAYLSPRDSSSAGTSTPQVEAGNDLNADTERQGDSSEQQQQKSLCASVDFEKLVVNPAFTAHVQERKERIEDKRLYVEHLKRARDRESARSL